MGWAVIRRYKANETAIDLVPGDFILTGLKAQGLVSLAIKLGSRIRGYDKAYRRFSHTALVIDQQGTIAEAVSKGVVYSHISRFHEADYVVVHTVVDVHDQEQIVAFVDSVVQSKTKYGFGTFVGLGLYCLTGGQWCIQKAGTAICSGLVSDALTRAGHIWERPPYAMMPADLARHFNVTWDE